jgi:hypothetical protein
VRKKQNKEQRENEMNGETAAKAETPENEYDPEAEVIMEILRQINAELDEIAEKLEEIGTIN